MAAVSSQREVQLENSTGSNSLPSNSETTAVCHHTKTNLSASGNGDISSSITFANETQEQHQATALAREDEDGVCHNGLGLHDQEPAFNLDPTSGLQNQETSPGVAGFHDNLAKSQGSSSESSAHKSEALQSLRLSLPMQETKLCSSEPPLALENEEQIRLQARKRLDEQLKQYRVKRQQERVLQTTPKHRLSSTLDPELMLNPETLPRASTVAMTKEYSFFRTSVQRGPKLGSLGLPASSKEKKSTRTSKSSKVRSLADYRTDESGLGNTSGRSPGDDVSSGSLKPNRGSSTSIVSEISLPSNVDDRLESSCQIADNVSEADGSEAGLRMDGNESDSSTYSSVSGVSSANTLPFLEGKQAVPYIVDGQEIPPEEVGQFPSISEVLQAAAAEHQSQTPDENGEVRSRRDSISSSVSIGSSMMGTHDEVLQILKEKMRLEGQLESLSLEATQALKEKTELQAQLAAVNAQLQAQVEQNELSQQKQSSLNSEVSTLKQTCSDLERSIADLQSSLEAKNASLVSLNTDLQMAEEQYQRLLGKVEELQQSVVGKDNTVLDLRQQMTSLQSQLQQVQLEKNTMLNSLKASQAEITSLQQSRQWYQQQLMLAQEARVRLQSEMANMQAGHVSQVGTLEYLKLENVALSQQLTETQHRSIKEKERIAAQLQSIEADMMDQDAAFHQIQQAKTMVEEDLQRKLEESEEQRDQLQKLADSATVLERELEQIKVTLHQRELQVEALQQEQLDLIKQLTMSQESQHTKEQSLNELQARYEELEAQIAEYQRESESKDDMIQNLRKEKIFLEVALQVAKEEKEALDKGTQRLEEGTEVASEVLEQLRQEIAVKSNQVESIQQDNATLKKQTQKLKEQFMQQKVMVEAYRRDASSKDQLVSELKATKKRLDSELRMLKQELLIVQGEKKSMEVEQSRLQKEVSHVRQQLTDMDAQLQSIQDERNELEIQLQSLQFDREQLKSLTVENEEFKKQLNKLQLEAKTAVTEQKQKMKKLGSDLTNAQKEMKSKHKAYENAVGILSRRLQEALTAKETAEAEVNRLKAQVTDGGDSQANLERLQALESELKVVSHSKTMLEKELQEIISLTSQELEDYREKVLELEDELQEARGFRKKIKRLEDLNKKLTLDLERERGKLTGLSQSHSALREHAKILETALANREADLVQLNLQVQAVLKRKEEEDQQMKQAVHTLQVALEKEKTKVRDLRQQVAAAKAEAALSRRHYRAAAMELSEVKKELQAKEQLVNALQAEADKLQSQEESHSQEVAQFQQELAEARAQLQLLQKQLDDELKKEPAVNQELEDLKWEVEQKEMEIQALKQQVDLKEQRTQKEIEGVQSALQRIKAELEVVREEQSGTQKDKFILEAKVTELKNSMKTLLMQNQQLKLELRHTKMRKKKELKEDANASNPVTPVKIPDCPVPASLLEELLKPVTALSKEPLNNLHNCLRQLREEMDTLQRQMEEHTVTVHESMGSWSQIEGQLMGLTAVCPTEDQDHMQSEATQPILGTEDFETLNQ